MKNAKYKQTKIEFYMPTIYKYLTINIFLILCPIL